MKERFPHPVCSMLEPRYGEIFTFGLSGNEGQIILDGVVVAQYACSRVVGNVVDTDQDFFSKKHLVLIKNPDQSKHVEYMLGHGAMNALYLDHEKRLFAGEVKTDSQTNERYVLVRREVRGEYYDDLVFGFLSYSRSFRAEQTVRDYDEICYNL